MVAFLLLFRSLWHILKILFRQEEQKAIMLALLFILLIGTVFYNNVEGMTYHHGRDREFQSGFG